MALCCGRSRSSYEEDNVEKPNANKTGFRSQQKQRGHHLLLYFRRLLEATGGTGLALEQLEQGQEASFQATRRR